MKSHQHTKECQAAMHAAVCASMHAAFLTSRCKEETHEKTMHELMGLFATLFHAVESGGFEIQAMNLSKETEKAIKDFPGVH